MPKTALLLLTILLSGCALGPDQYGDERRPFGTDETRRSSTVEYTANNRQELIVWCHDVGGYISRDGLNCVWAVHPLAFYTYIPPCVTAFVRDAKRDEDWTAAVCNGWRPGL